MNALNIDPDDDVSIVEDVERSFGIQLTDTEAAQSYTVGDLYRVLLRRVCNVERAAFPCLAATAFRRLRTSLETETAVRNFSPKMPLSDILPSRDLLRWWKALEARSGLVLPPLLISNLGNGVILIVFLATASTSLMYSGVAIAVLAATLAGYVTLRACDKWLPGFRNPHGVITVGDLATEASVRNASSLAWRHGAMRKAEIWRVLVYILRRYGSAPIDDNTRFFP